MKIAFVIDPIHKLKPHKDSTLAMIKSACAAGVECFYMLQEDIFCTGNAAFAAAHHITVNELADDIHKTAICKPAGVLPLTTFDIILMRKDPPFDLEYIYTTYALELAEAAGVIVSNKPQSLRDANEKFFILNFPACIPTSMVSRNIAKLRTFWQEHRRVVYKPLYGMGGKAVFIVNEDGHNLSVILETLTADETISIMAQVYIPEIKTHGDKRILLVNGKPAPYALARMPGEGETRGNLAAGGTPVVTTITERDLFICNTIAPTLQARGLHFVGIDVIGDYLTEINVTSPTCIQEIGRESNINIADDYIAFLLSLKAMNKINK